MRDRPAFHEVEPPRIVTGSIDGFTDEQWAARNERRAARYRRVFEAMFVASALATFVVSVWPIPALPGWLWLGLALVWLADILLFAAAVAVGYLRPPFP